MSDSVKYYQLRDFNTIRICCHHSGCNTAFELHPTQVEAAMKKTGGCCPLCGKPFTKPDVDGGADVVTQLARVIVALNNLAGNVGIELPVVIRTEPRKLVP